MIMNYYRVLDKSKFQFDFLYFTEEKCDFDDEIGSLGGRIFRIAPHRTLNTIRRMTQLWKLLRSQPEIKVIHCHTLLSSSFFILSAWFAGIEVRVVHSHNTNAHGSRGVLRRIYELISIKVIDLFATDRVACGERAAEYLFPNRTNVMQLQNSIDLQRFSKVGADSTEYLKSQYQLTDACLKLIQVGRLQEVKNHQFSISIASRLKEQGIDFAMFFIGKGELEKQIASEIVRYGLEGNVFILGARSDVSEIMGGADVMLMPSLYEGFPVVLVESQAVGLPALVASTISREVDLGVGLVDFLSLNESIESWIDKIKDRRLKKDTQISEFKRVELLANKGFDSNTNVKILDALYMGALK